MKNPTHEAIPWKEIKESKEFRELALSKRKTIAFLFVVGMLCFFSIPFLSTVFPGFLSIQIVGPINIGLIWGPLQYPIGGLIAWRYAVQMRETDAKLASLKSDFAKFV